MPNMTEGEYREGKMRADRSTKVGGGKADTET